MTDNVQKILKLYENMVVLSILESKDRYIVSVCNKDVPIESATESLFAIDKDSFKTSEFSYFNNPDEYAEACENVVYKYDEEDELTHWGVRGMKWGVRRYQNKDGSLTKAGQRRYNKEIEKAKEEARVLKNRETTKAKLDKLEALRKSNAARKAALDGDKKTKEKTVNDKTVKKSIKDMTDEELSAAVNRARLEDSYNQLRPQNAQIKPSFAKKFVNEALAPALVNSGRTAIQNFLNQKAAEMMKEKVDPNSLEALMVTKNKLQAKYDIKTLQDKISGKKNDNDINWDQLNKKQQYIHNEEKREWERQDRAKKDSGSNNVVNNNNVNAGKKIVNNVKTNPVNSYKLPKNKDWDDFVSQYSWGREPYAMDEIYD